MFQQHRQHLPTSTQASRSDEHGVRMALGPLGGTPAPKPKPIEQKACLIAERLEQLGKELVLPETTPERSAQIQARIADLGRRAEWLLGGEFEQGVVALRDALQKRIFGSGPAVPSQLYLFAARALRGGRGIPAPAAQQPPMPQIGAAGAGVPNFQRMFSSPVPPSPEIITEYIAHLTTLSSPAILVSGIRAIPGSRGVDFEVFEEATKRNEIGLLLGGLRVLLHDKDPCRVESALPLLQVLNAEAEYALRRSESGNGFTRASALWLLGGQLRYLKVPQVPTTLETLALYAANSEDPRLRSAAPGVLLYCSSKSAQKAWEKLTKDQLSSVRCAALRACLQRGVAVPEGVSLQSIESLQRTAEAPCDFAAAEAAAACLRGGSTQTQLRLIELAADESRASRLRAVALSALERSPLPAAQEALFAQLSSAEDEVAAAAARTLRMGSAAALRPRILEQAKDPNRTWGARKYAVQALGRKTTSIEQKALLEFMTSSDATAALDAAQCLADAETCFVRPQLVRTVEGQLVSGNPLGAMSSVVALGRVRTLEERYLMMKALGHSFSVVRQAAAEVMLRTGSDALDSPVHLSKVQDVVMGAGKEGIAREVELAEALHFLFVEAGIV